MAGNTVNRNPKAQPVNLSLSREEADTAKRILAKLVSIGREPDVDLLHLANVIRNSLKERAHFFGADFFGDPGWGIILSLYCAEGHGERLSITVLGRSAGLPQSTVSRWLPELIGKGLIERFQGDGDQRRVFLRLTRSGHGQMNLWLRHVASQLVLVWPTA